jgi:hypothetical protein
VQALALHSLQTGRIGDTNGGAGVIVAGGGLNHDCKLVLYAFQRSTQSLRAMLQEGVGPG